MDLADRVWLLMQAEKDPKKQTILMEKCRRDIVFWWNNFAWTFDPRADKPDIPFTLYPYQEWFVKEVLDAIESQHDMGCEKSRDMGVSWMIMMVFLYCWLFRSGYNFHIGSRKESEVDQAAVDPAETLFGKLRYCLYRLPRWMRVDDEKITDKKCHLMNGNNGNIITGEAASPFFGRGARKRAILLDEFAFFPDAEAAWQSCSQSTNCRIVISTPWGESNKYYKLMHDSRNEYRPIPEEFLGPGSVPSVLDV